MKKATITFLVEFYHKNKIYKVNDQIEIDVDLDNKPLDPFWYEQIRFNDNHFELKSPVNNKKK